MKITVYSLPTSVCVQCRAVEISMRRKGIQAEKIMVDEDPKALEYIKSLGYSQAPVIVVMDGDEVVEHWSGFSEERLNALQQLVAA